MFVSTYKHKHPACTYQHEHLACSGEICSYATLCIAWSMLVLVHSSRLLLLLLTTCTIIIIIR
jgi:hypothetical protein